MFYLLNLTRKCLLHCNECKSSTRCIKIISLVLCHNSLQLRYSNLTKLSGKFILPTTGSDFPSCGNEKCIC